MRWALTAPLALAGWLAATVAAASVPVVVELYTAQGCASCAKANGFAASLADHSGVIELTFNVDYWDYLGWKDTFAQPDFAERQRAYDKRFGLRDVYTPQIVVAGAGQVAGDNQAEAETLIRAARRSADRGPKITPRADGTVAIEGAPRRRHAHDDDVWLVRYAPHPPAILVKDGDNRGQTVSHRNVVRQLVRLGEWEGRKRVFHLPATSEDGLISLILVQGENGGRILAAMRLPAKA